MSFGGYGGEREVLGEGGEGEEEAAKFNLLFAEVSGKQATKGSQPLGDTREKIVLV